MTQHSDDVGPELDDGELDDGELDRELERADTELSSRLRELVDHEVAATDGDELRRRTAKDVDRALRARSTLGAALELIGTGWWTATTLLTDDTPPADRGREGR